MISPQPMWDSRTCNSLRGSPVGASRAFDSREEEATASLWVVPESTNRNPLCQVAGGLSMKQVLDIHRKRVAPNGFDPIPWTPFLMRPRLLSTVCRASRANDRRCGGRRGTDPSGAGISVAGLCHQQTRVPFHFWSDLRKHPHRAPAGSCVFVAYEHTDSSPGATLSDVNGRYLLCGITK